MTDRPRSRDLRSRLAPWGLAAVLLATSLAVARTFAPEPGRDGPGPSSSAGAAASVVTGEYRGPDLYGIFTGCNPACDLEVAVEGIGRRLTFTDRAIDESAPSLSPDRARVVYRCAEPATEPGADGSPRPAGLGSLCLVDTIDPEDQAATPAAPTTLVAADGVDYGGPAWSPDGTVIVAEARGPDGSSSLVVVDPASGRVTPVTRDAGDFSRPAWSRDGSLLAFACGSGTETPHETTRFCTMPREGGKVTAFGEVAGSCGTPAFMPDGVHFGVVCVAPGADGADLYVLSLDEPFTHQFTTGGLIAPEGIRRVVFDPDQRFAFVRRDDALWAIAIPEVVWSMPALPPLHGDFDLRVRE